MPKSTKNLPLCPGYGDEPCPVGERVRAAGRKYGAVCAKLSRAGFKEMMASQAAEREERASTYNTLIALAMETAPDGPATTLEFPQGRGKFPNHLERIGQGTRKGASYFLTVPSRSQALALAETLRDEGIGVKVV